MHNACTSIIVRTTREHSSLTTKTTEKKLQLTRSDYLFHSFTKKNYDFISIGFLNRN